MTSILRIYVTLIVDFISAAVFGLQAILYLATGAVYPVLPHDKQLLDSLGIYSFFPVLVLGLLLISLLITSFIYHKSVNGLLKKLNHQSELPISFRKTWFEFGPLWVSVTLFAFFALSSLLNWLFFSTLSITSTVILNILFYPLAGYSLGQLVKTVKIFLWERRNSKRIFLDLEGKLLAK